MDGSIRRRSAAALTCALLALVAGCGDVAPRSAGAEASPSEAPSPSPTAGETAPRPPLVTGTYAALTPEQITRHPRARHDSPEDHPATASDVVARVWVVCLADCRDRKEAVRELQWALEISRDDFATSALYPYVDAGYLSHAVGDWYFADGHGGPRLHDARGHRRTMSYGAPVAVEDVRGPLVYSYRGLASLDLRTKVVHPLPRREVENWDWQGAADTWFWGTASLVNDDTTVTRMAVLWRRPDGRFATYVLPIGDRGGGPGVLRAGTPGTMAVVDHFTERRRAHISTDYGATWEVRRLPADQLSGGVLPADWRTWPAG